MIFALLLSAYVVVSAELAGYNTSRASNESTVTEPLSTALGRRRLEPITMILMIAGIAVPAVIGLVGALAPIAFDLFLINKAEAEEKKEAEEAKKKKTTTTTPVPATLPPPETTTSTARPPQQAPRPPPPPPPPKKKEKGFPMWGYIAAGVGAVVLLGMVFLMMGKSVMVVMALLPAITEEVDTQEDTMREAGRVDTQEDTMRVEAATQIAIIEVLAVAFIIAELWQAM